MLSKIQLGMTEYASSRFRPRFHKLYILLAWAFLISFISFRNYQYLSSGMLTPKFQLIHEAYVFNLWYLPLSLITLAVLCCFLARRVAKVYIYSACLLFFLAIDLFILRYYITYVEPQKLVVRHIIIESPKVSSILRILHLSDIQCGAVGSYEEKVFRTIDSLNPDLIINTGDYLQTIAPATFESEFPKLVQLIRNSNAPYGTFGVFGDTELELYSIPKVELGALKLLSSRSELILTHAGRIHLHGLSLYESKNPEWAKRAAVQWLDESSDNDFRILFGHSPDYALGVKALPIDLCLAGHTHGGQVRLPFVGALVIDSKIPNDWSRGFRKIGTPFLNVSAGVGSNRFGGLPPIRFNCPSEMSLIELVPIKKSLTKL